MLVVRGASGEGISQLGGVQAEQHTAGDEILYRGRDHGEATAAAVVGSGQTHIAAGRCPCGGVQHRAALAAVQHPREQVAAGAAATGQCFLLLHGERPVVVVFGDDRRPCCRADDFPAMASQAGDTPGGDYRGDGRRAPLLPGHTRYL